MHIIVCHPLPVDRQTGKFAGAQKTSTDELEAFPEAASTVTTSLKGGFTGKGDSAEGQIQLRSHGVQLVPGGRIVSNCATDGWVPWKAFG